MKQYVAVNGDGYFIGDAILFYLEEGLFDLVGASPVPGLGAVPAPRPAPTTSRSSATRTRRRRLGPAEAVPLRAAGPDRRPGGRAGDRLAAPRCQVLQHDGLHHRGPRRAGAAPRDGRPAGLRALRPVAGRRRCPGRAARRRASGLGLVRAGARAYSTANLESGWIPRPPSAIFGEGDEGVPGVAPGGGRGLARREHGLAPTSPTTTSPHTTSAMGGSSGSTTTSSAVTRWRRSRTLLAARRSLSCGIRTTWRG